MKGYWIAVDKGGCDWCGSPPIGISQPPPAWMREGHEHTCPSCDARWEWRGQK